MLQPTSVAALHPRRLFPCSLPFAAALSRTAAFDNLKLTSTPCAASTCGHIDRDRRDIHQRTALACAERVVIELRSGKLALEDLQTIDQLLDVAGLVGS